MTARNQSHPEGDCCSKQEFSRKEQPWLISKYSTCKDVDIKQGKERDIESYLTVIIFHQVKGKHIKSKVAAAGKRHKAAGYLEM